MKEESKVLAFGQEHGDESGDPERHEDGFEKDAEENSGQVGREPGGRGEVSREEKVGQGDEDCEEGG